MSAADWANGALLVLFIAGCGVVLFFEDRRARAQFKPLPQGGDPENSATGPGIEPQTPFDVSPWHPMRDPVDLKTTGKALEELGECVAALSRCQIQGLDEVNPDGGKVNRVWLEQEMDDVRAQFNLLAERFHLRSDPARIERKKKNQRVWHRMA